MTELKDIRLFLMDLDGTIYHENVLIDGATQFFKLLQEQKKKYVFMTNNSSRNKSTYVKKLNGLGIDATEDDIASSVNATILYLNKNKPHAKLYLIGTESFKEELLNEGFDVVPTDYRDDDVDFVVMGYDTELTYAKLVGGCYYISRGYKYIATNCDWKCPLTDNKYVPDCGSFALMIEKATNRLPLFLGKPERTLMDYVSEKTGIPISQIACIGDRLYTDIAVGINAGATTICVLSGEATQKDIDESEFKPDYIFPSIKEVYEALK